MNLAERQRGLLRLVADYREQECRRLLAAAREEAAEIRRQSFRKQRAYLHNYVLAERSRARAEIQAARAEQRTRERGVSERRSLELLQAALPMLRERLLQRWRVPEQRRRWTETYLHRALDLLAHGGWTVRHAAEWHDGERAELRAELTEILGQEPSFRCETAIEAGLIVESGGAVLDASLRGLLQDRTRLEARLLALLAAEAGP